MPRGGCGHAFRRGPAPARADKVHVSKDQAEVVAKLADHVILLPGPKDKSVNAKDLKRCKLEVVDTGADPLQAKTPDEGAFAPMALLFSSELEGNGRYYGSDAKRSPLDKYRAPGTPAFEGP